MNVFFARARSLRARSLRLIFVLLMLLAGAGSAHAQEAQVPLDEEGRLSALDADTERRLDFFPEYEGFQEAQLFQVGPSRYELVVTYRRDGQTLRDRQALSEAEVEALRRRVSQRLAARQVRPNLNQEGRYELLFATTVLGLYEGGLIPIALDAENDDVYAAGPLIGATAGFFVPLLLTRNAPVTEAAGTMAIYGTYQGLAHGGLTSLLLFGDEDSGQATAGITAAFAAGEALIAYRLANRFDLRAGTAETIGYGSLAGGLISGALTAAAFGDEPSDDVVRAYGATILGGTVAGSYLGYRLARADGFTQGDGRVWLLSGAIAAQVAGAGLVAADAESARAIGSVLAAGAVSGLAAGRALVRDRDFTAGQANIIALGTFAGSALGSALAITADADAETAFALSAIGSVAGFGATYATYAGEARTPTASGWQINVNPYGLYGALSPDRRVDPATAPAALTLRRTF